jgi:hypothetical protein
MSLLETHPIINTLYNVTCRYLKPFMNLMCIEMKNECKDLTGKSYVKENILLSRKNAIENWTGKILQYRSQY